MNKPLLVLDTNVVLDLLHFDDATARPLRLALEDGRVRCVVTDATLAEWRRVLAYPEFALDPIQQAALFARYQALAVKADSAGADVGLPPTHYGLKPVWSRMPRCSDSDDQKFIELAAAAEAQGLVSKDRAVLKLRRRCAPFFQVMTPVEAVRWLHDVAGVAA
ncbi:MAG: PIN domain-containing protein [Thiobacillus sp.]